MARLPGLKDRPQHVDQDAFDRACKTQTQGTLRRAPSGNDRYGSFKTVSKRGSARQDILAHAVGWAPIERSVTSDAAKIWIRFNVDDVDPWSEWHQEFDATGTLVNEFFI